MGSNPEDCPVCYTAYDDYVQRPRNLPCGHTFCTQCINEIQDDGMVSCPTCCLTHFVPSEGQFPVSYTVEALIEHLRDIKEAAAASLELEAGKEKTNARSPRHKGKASISKTMHSLLQEKEANVLATITTCQEVQSQLAQYQTLLTGWGDQQQQLEKKLENLVAQSKEARASMLQEKSQASIKKEQVQQEEEMLHTVLGTPCMVNTEQEACEAVIDIVCRIGEAEQRMEECQEMFPNVDTLEIIRKVKNLPSEALEPIQNVHAALETVDVPGTASDDCSLQTDSVVTVSSKLQALLTPTIKIKDLHSLRQPVKSLLKVGRVFAVHQIEGRNCYAKISYDNGQLYLHSLQEESLHPNAVILQVSQVVPSSPPCLVFLDLAWSGSETRRVLVRLSPDTLMGRQFVLLCTGQRGFSYASTKLFEVLDKGEPGECICGGDYESNDGKGGAALLPDIHKSEYRRSSRAGAVRGAWFGPARGAQFRITTKDLLCGEGSDADVYGEVVGGLEALVAAAHHEDITEVTVVDCGVVLWG